MTTPVSEHASGKPGHASRAAAEVLPFSRLEQVQDRLYPSPTRRRRMVRRLTIGGVVLTFPLSVPVWLVRRSMPRHRSNRRIQKALTVRDQAIEALTLLEEAHDRNPANHEILLLAGALAHHAGLYDEARQYLEYYVERSQPEGLARLILGDACYRTERYDQAIVTLQAMDEDEPGWTMGQVVLAASFEKLGDPEAALNTLRFAPPSTGDTLSEEQKALHFHLADLYERMGDEAGAIRHYRRVYTRDIRYRDVYERLKRLEDASRPLKK